jgi:hypothetical protein
MDDEVLAAIAKWPSVPAVYGWLALSARGDWLLRGEPIRNAAIRAFIGRNYASDERGCWFFQNGPQRVYVELEVAPWVWRTGPDAQRPALAAHTGAPVERLRGAWLDENGRLFLLTELGCGLLHGADVPPALAALGLGDDRAAAALADWLRGTAPPPRVDGTPLGLCGRVELARLDAAAAPAQFGFVRTPRPD